MFVNAWQWERMVNAMVAQGQVADEFEAGVSLGFMGMEVRAELGQVVGALVHAFSAWNDDEISAHYGIWPAFDKQAARIAHEHGWSLAEVQHELNRREISEKWQNDMGLGFIINHNTH